MYPVWNLQENIKAHLLAWEEEKSWEVCDAVSKETPNIVNDRAEFLYFVDKEENTGRAGLFIE